MIDKKNTHTTWQRLPFSFSSEREIQRNLFQSEYRIGQVLFK